MGCQGARKVLSRGAEKFVPPLSGTPLPLSKRGRAGGKGWGFREESSGGAGEDVEAPPKGSWGQTHTRGGGGGIASTQTALRDRLMSRGKNCLPTVSRQFLTRNYPRPNCLLKCLPNCLFPTREGFLSSFNITLKTVTSLNKEARLLKFHFSYAIRVSGDNELKCSKCHDRKARIAFRTSKCCNR